MCNVCVGLVKYTIKANTTLLVRIFDNLRWLLTSNFLLGVVVSYSLQERYLFRPDALFSVLSLWWPTHRSIPNPIIHCVETCHEYNWNSVCDVGNQSVQLYLTILNYEHSPILLLFCLFLRFFYCILGLYRPLYFCNRYSFVNRIGVCVYCFYSSIYLYCRSSST
jgi:hypothetical protein